MNLNKHYEDVKLELQIAPLIDVVFLLLIYFMVTASLIRKEGDISFMLPANIAQEDMVDIPVEVLIEITNDGTVQVEGMRFDRNDKALDDLVNQIAGLKQMFDDRLADSAAAANDQVVVQSTEVILQFTPPENHEQLALEQDLSDASERVGRRPEPADDDETGE